MCNMLFVTCLVHWVVSVMLSCSHADVCCRYVVSHCHVNGSFYRGRGISSHSGFAHMFHPGSGVISHLFCLLMSF